MVKSTKIGHISESSRYYLFNDISFAWFRRRPNSPIVFIKISSNTTTV